MSLSFTRFHTMLQASGSGNRPCLPPTEYDDGDLLILLVSISHSSGTMHASMTSALVADGWTIETYSTKAYVCHKVADGETATTIFFRASSATRGTRGWMFAVKGATDWDWAGASGIDPPELALVGGKLWVSFCADTAGTYWPPTGFHRRLRASGTNHSLQIAAKLGAHDSLDPDTWTGSTATGASVLTLGFAGDFPAPVEETAVHASLYAPEFSENPSASTFDPVAPLTAEVVEAAGFQPNDEVLLLTRFNMRVGNTTQRIEQKIMYGETELTDPSNTMRYYPGATGRVKTQMHMARFNLGETILDIEGFTRKASNTISNFTNVSMLLLRLSDFGEENVDWFWNDQAAGVTLTSTADDTDLAAVTWTPSAAEDWVFLANHMASGSFGSQVWLDGGSIQDEFQVAVAEAADKIGVLWPGLLADLSAEEHTLSVASRRLSSSGTSRNSALFVFRRSRWPDMIIDQPGTTEIAASGVPTVAGSVSGSLSMAQPVVYLGAGNVEGTSGDNVNIGFIRDETQIIEKLENVQSYVHGTIHLPMIQFGRVPEIWEALDLDVFFTTDEASPVDVVNPTIILWGMHVLTSSPSGSIQIGSVFDVDIDGFPLIHLYGAMDPIDFVVDAGPVMDGLKGGRGSVAFGVVVDGYGLVAGSGNIQFWTFTPTLQGPRIASMRDENSPQLWRFYSIGSGTTIFFEGGVSRTQAVLSPYQVLVADPGSGYGDRMVWASPGGPYEVTPAEAAAIIADGTYASDVAYG